MDALPPDRLCEDCTPSHSICEAPFCLVCGPCPKAQELRKRKTLERWAGS